jgi:hypothetical protein
VPATSARFPDLGDALAVDTANGDTYFTDTGVVYRVAAGTLTAVARVGRLGLEPALPQLVTGEIGALAAHDGSLYGVDVTHSLIRVLTPAGVRTVAGTGTKGCTGDHGSATSAQIDLSSTDSGSALTVDSVGDLLFVDATDARVRRVDLHGIITTVAGTGQRGAPYGYGKAVQNNLDDPTEITTGPDGTFYIDDGARILNVDARGDLTVVSGG